MAARLDRWSRLGAKPKRVSGASKPRNAQIAQMCGNLTRETPQPGLPPPDSCRDQGASKPRLDAVAAHHLVVLVLHDVPVPDELAYLFPVPTLLRGNLFSLYRADIPADLEAGTFFAFTIGQGFLLGVTIYVVLPSLMLFLSLVLRVRVTRMANIVAAVLYAVAIVGGAIGEWNYYILGSITEAAFAGRRRLLRVDLAEGDRRRHRPGRPVPGRHRSALFTAGARVAPDIRF